MKIAKITALFPPAVIGGAEISAANLAVRMTEYGHNVSVLSTTTQSDEAGPVHETYADRIDVWRYRMPRTYTALNYADHGAAEKLVWHAQDHIDRRNRKVWSDFLDRTRPDVAFVHVAQGLGYNGLTELGRRDIPTVMVLHDLSLACYKMAMFSNGHPCETQHALCRVSSQLKLRYLRQIPRLGFISPSRANYETVCRFLPIADYPHRVILNANGHDLSTETRETSRSLRLIYAGQIAEAKGVGFLLDVVDKLPPGTDVTLRVVGDGPDLERLRSLYESRPWVTFEGRVTPADVSRMMAKADILCVPSLWPENSPGVIGQGMACGLAVFGSRRGGIPELVEDGVTGRILAPGDAAVWTEAIIASARDRTPLGRWSEAVGDVARNFNPDQSVQAYLAFAETVIASTPR